MSSLIHELQHAALDESSSVSSLLRKALLVASKLGVPDFEAWVRHELEGYGQTPVPGYRVITGAPKVFNPYRGYQDLSTDDPDLAEAATIHVETLIQGVSGSQIQVHSPGAQQHQGLSTQQLTDIKTLVELVSKVLPSEPTQREDIRELRAEIETLRAQSESPKPKRSVLRESLGSVRAIIEGAAGELLASHLPEAIALVSGLLHSL